MTDRCHARAEAVLLEAPSKRVRRWTRRDDPQERNPNGEVHEEIGLFSFDPVRKARVFREFHVEGFVNRDLLESWDPDSGVLVFVTESIEYGPPNWEARTTYGTLDENRFRERFELRKAGEEWGCFTTVELQRVPDAASADGCPNHVSSRR